VKQGDGEHKTLTSRCLLKFNTDCTGAWEESIA